MNMTSNTVKNIKSEELRNARTVIHDKVEGHLAMILNATFVGNPIMHHLLLGIDPTELGGAPFALATNSGMYERLKSDMDINAGKIISDGASVKVVGEEIFQKLLDVASGEHPLSESQGLGDYEFVPWQIGATM